jgi:uncharacterized membrane protein YeaQ/YmgE (transglycosylase-associated protein family)
MHLMWWIIVGLVAGILAKALVPGTKKEPQGCLYTILLGIGGSVLTGFVLHNVLNERTSGTMFGSIIGATLGAMALILIFRKVWK